jgi:hypothetical protein
LGNGAGEQIVTMLDGRREISEAASEHEGEEPKDLMPHMMVKVRSMPGRALFDGGSKTRHIVCGRRGYLFERPLSVCSQSGAPEQGTGGTD